MKARTVFQSDGVRIRERRVPRDPMCGVEPLDRFANKTDEPVAFIADPLHDGFSIDREATRLNPKPGCVAHGIGPFRSRDQKLGRHTPNHRAGRPVLTALDERDVIACLAGFTVGGHPGRPGTDHGDIYSFRHVRGYPIYRRNIRSR
nr:hypothetical protein [Rhodovibrio sodomensis]